MPDVDEERNYNVRFLDVHNLGYLGSGDPIRGFDETELMRQLQDFIASQKSDAHFESWSAFSVPVSKIYSDAQRRLDLKYWDPRVTGAIAALEQRGCPTLQDLAVTEIKRGKSPPAESYVDEQDGYALVVKAGSNITKYGELVQVGDFIEKQLFEKMPDIHLREM